jgi:hypothetical protein
MGLALPTLPRLQPIPSPFLILLQIAFVRTSEFLSQRNTRNYTLAVARSAVHGGGASQTVSSVVMHDDIGPVRLY